MDWTLFSAVQAQSPDDSLSGQSQAVPQGTGGLAGLRTPSLHCCEPHEEALEERGLRKCGPEALWCL